MTDGQLRRHSLEAQAGRLTALLESTEARQALDAVRTEIIAEMELLKLDGGIDANAQAVELVRRLQTLLAFKRELLRPIARQRAEEAKLSRKDA